MKLYNKSNRTYQHSYFDKEKKLVVLNLYPKKHADIPDDVAKIWLATGEVVEYVDPKEVKKAEAAAAKKQVKLEAENEKLKAELEKLKAELEKLKAEAAEKALADLKKEADDLGVKYQDNIGLAKLQEKVDSKKAEQK